MTQPKEVTEARDALKRYYKARAHEADADELGIALENLLSLRKREAKEPVVELKRDELNGGYHVTDKHGKFDAHAFGGLEGTYRRVLKEGE